MKYSKIIILAILVMVIACAKEKALQGDLSDKNLYKYVIDTTGKVYYQNSTILTGLGPHGNYRMHFNDKAAAVLDGTLELPVGQSFPDSSLIVKEVTNGTNITLYAVMFKHKGTWLWAEYGPTGNVVHGIGEGSAVCTQCHAVPPNRDNVLSFDLH